MGLYDCRCMISGVSLKGARAVLVLLQQQGTRHVPISLGMSGTYNRLGSLDQVDTDAHTAMVFNFFRDQRAAGNFVVDIEYLRAHELYPIEELEHLFGAFERNINDHPAAAVLRDEPIVFALIAQSVWDAIVKVVAPRAINHDELFQNSPIAAQIYSRRTEPMEGPAKELASIQAFLRSRDIAWHRADDPSQHYWDDMLQYLDDARREFAECDPVLRGLLMYEVEVQELMKKD